MTKWIKKEDEGFFAAVALMIIALSVFSWAIYTMYKQPSEVQYLMDNAAHQGQINELFFQRIDYLMETSSEFIDDDYIHGWTNEERELLK